ncbi:MAG: DMT family transporter [Chloroflexota bacterium]|nr:DMT family transporter [Chloroflexota bacterium]
MRRELRTGYMLTILAAVVWASTSPAIKYLLDTLHVPALAIAFWRDAFMAAACGLVLLAVRPSLLRVSRRDLRGLALVGAISIGIYHALWVFSVALNGAAVAVVLIYTFPTFVTVGAWLLFGERIGWPQVAALALALFGCALLVRAYDPAVFQVSWLGTLVGLATGITHAGYVLYSQRSVESRSPWTSMTYTMLFGSIVLLILWYGSAAFGATEAVGAGSVVRAVGDTATPWLALLVLALGPTLGGYALFTLALRYIPGRLASLAVMIEAPVSVLLAVIFLGERLEWPQILGIALILGAVGLPRLLAGDERQASTADVRKVGEPVADG